MRFLTDQDVYAKTIRLLEGLDHDVATVKQLGIAQADDESIIQAAQSDKRILVTRDRDFGVIVILQRRGAGVIYLRMLPATANVLHDELERVLTLYDERQLLESFVVVEPARHRIRKLRMS